MAQIDLYTTRVCPYCVAAKKLLQAKGLDFREIDVSNDGEKRAFIAQESGQRTVPQIFIDGRSIGGFQELSALEKSGELDQLVGD